MNKSSLLLGLLLLLLSCKGGGTAENLSDVGDTIRLQYARNITMVRYGNRIKVELANPWGKGLLGSYLLVPRTEGVGMGNPSSGMQQVTIPLENALVFTAVHCGLICELGMEDCIGGVCERQYIHCLTKDVVDCGNGMSPNQERIIQLNPDAMLVSPFESNTGHDKLGQLGIPHSDFSFSRDVLSSSYTYPCAVHTFSGGISFIDSTGYIVEDLNAKKIIKSERTVKGKNKEDTKYGRR